MGVPEISRIAFIQPPHVKKREWFGRVEIYVEMLVADLPHTGVCRNLKRHLLSVAHNVHVACEACPAQGAIGIREAVERALANCNKIYRIIHSVRLTVAHAAVNSNPDRPRASSSTATRYPCGQDFSRELLACARA